MTKYYIQWNHLQSIYFPCNTGFTAFSFRFILLFIILSSFIINVRSIYGFLTKPYWILIFKHSCRPNANIKLGSGTGTITSISVIFFFLYVLPIIDLIYNEHHKHLFYLFLSLFLKNKYIQINMDLDYCFSS